MKNTKNVTNLNLVKNNKKENSKVSALSPREIVSELDRYVTVSYTHLTLPTILLV